MKTAFLERSPKSIINQMVNTRFWQTFAAEFDVHLASTGHLPYEELCETAAVWHLSLGDEEGDVATTLGLSLYYVRPRDHNSSM